MKKLIAMLLVLMLALPCIALAEPSTAYTIGFRNPVITLSGEALDMTGLDLELSALVSDAGLFAVTALLNVGENFENTALSAQAQLDTNGLTFTADGMSSVYSLDLTQFTNGFDVTTLLPMLPVYSLLKTPIEMESAAIDLSLPVRYNAVSELFAEYSENGVISIDRTQGELLVNQLLTSVESAASSASVDMEGIAELRAMRLAFDMTGDLMSTGDPAANNGSYTLTGSGNLYSAEYEESLPYTIELKDTNGVTNAVINLNEPDGTEVIAITLDSTSTPAADGRSKVEAEVNMTMTDTEDPSVCEEIITCSYSATPEAGSPRMDYVAALNVPSEEAEFTLTVSTGTNGNDIGWAIDLFMNADGTSGNAFMYYTGSKTTDSLGTAIEGQFTIGGDFNGENAIFETGLLLRDTAMDTADWGYDSSNAIDIQNMDDNQSNTAMMGLMGIAGTALGLVNEHVPGLAPLLGSMMG